ncbi:MAG: anti-sigma factor [Neobacillus sp.]
MKCSVEIVELMHAYLDEEIDPNSEMVLREHLHSCKECEELFNELKRTIALVKGTTSIQAPENFTANVMALLPKEKKKVGFQRWMRNHPLIAAASLFLLLMTGSVFSTWNQGNDFSVSKQENLIVQNDTVIVPEGEVVKGDVIVRNGTLKIEGEVQGNVTVINGEQYLASAGKVTGKIEEVNEVFDWIWFHIKKTAFDVFNVFEEHEEK